MTGWRQFHPVAPEDSRENRPLGSVTLARLRDLRDRRLSVNRSRNQENRVGGPPKLTGQRL